MRRVNIAVLVFILLGSRSPAQEYTITDLGTLGGETSEANAINASGQVVGAAAIETGQNRAFLWESGIIFNLGVLPGRSRSAARAINDAGVVVGESIRAARFSVSGPPQQIGPDKDLVARAINSSGDVCGTYDDARTAFAIISGVYSELPTLGGSDGYAYDISDTGVIVGTAQVAGDTVFKAFQRASGINFMIPDLGGTRARANAINNNGDIVGYTEVAGSAFYRAFLYKAGAFDNFVDLGTLARFSEAMALNEQRVAVGYSFDTNGVSRAVRFSGGQVADLNTLIKPGSSWLLTQANGINDSGWIVGTGTNPSGKTRGFLLRPDLAPPTVRFSKRGTVRSQSSRAKVTGTATDNVFVKRVEFRVGNGRFKKASGGSKWSVQATLRPGRNQISVRAIDGAGNLSRISTLTVFRS
jgi:probable HAF family extracellular repeat protein